jgi:predicted nucleotidyltransferase
LKEFGIECDINDTTDEFDEIVLLSRGESRAWYDTSDQVRDRLYGTDHGVGILERVEWDVSAAAATLLGEDTAAILGPDRCSELLTRWPGSRNETPSQ